MKVHRYIYTRLGKDLSPTGKNGFQSAFIPEILSNKEVLEIESHIHFPENVKLEDQSVVFCKQVKGEWMLVLLRLRPLADVRDEHGRGGTFLCEGFLVHESDWRPMWRITDLIALVEPHRFTSLEALLGSPDVDRSAGRITALEVSVPSGYWERGLVGSLQNPEPELLMAMYRVARKTEHELSVVVEGPPATVTTRLEACALFLPDVLRPHVGWDDAFDGGKIFFSPLRIFGYSSMPPTTGRPVVFDAAGGAARWPDNEMATRGQADDAFGTWLLHACKAVQPREKLGQLYALSEALASGRPLSPHMPSDPEFEELNADRIRKVFVPGMAALLDGQWAERLGGLCSTHQQLQIWLEGYTTDSVGRLLASAIMEQGLCPELMPTAPPSKFMQKASPTLQVLASMWTMESPGKEVMQALPAAHVEPALQQLLGRGPHDKLPLAALVDHFSGAWSHLKHHPKVAENLGYYLAAKVPASYGELAERLGGLAVQQGAFEALHHPEQLDWLGLLNAWIGSSRSEKPEWKALRELGKGMDLGSYGNLVAFANGTAPVSADLQSGGPGRSSLLRCLRELHGKKEKALLEMGFSQAELEESEPQGGFLGRIKRLFGG